VNPHSGEADILVAEVSGSGVLEWHTFFGSVMTDAAQAVRLDADRNVNVAGFGNTTWGQPVNPHAGGSNPDAAVARIQTRTYYVYLPLASRN
jgi:hypothetical protein